MATLSEQPLWSVQTELTCNCLLPLSATTVLVGCYELGADGASRAGRLDALDTTTHKFHRFAKDITCGIFDLQLEDNRQCGEAGVLLVSCTDGALRRVACDTGDVVDCIQVDSEMLTSTCSFLGSSVPLPEGTPDHVPPTSREYVCAAHLGQLHHVMAPGSCEGDSRVVRSWAGHEFDAWCVASAGSCSAILSGGDDGFLRVWDLRQPNASAKDATGKMRFDAGVVTIVPATDETGKCITVGSYDESLYLVDLRFLKKPVSSTKVGGGAWRCRPLRNGGNESDGGSKRSDLFVCAAMQGGATVVAMDRRDEKVEMVGSFGNNRDNVLCYDVAVVSNGFKSSSSSLEEEEGSPTKATVLTCSFYERVIECWELVL